MTSISESPVKSRYAKLFWLSRKCPNPESRHPERSVYLAALFSAAK
jgi:hypothetical protein